jgi:hypothetical protein
LLLFFLFFFISCHCRGVKLALCAGGLVGALLVDFCGMGKA